MFEHVNAIPTGPTRVVIIGAQGFVGSAAKARLEKSDIEVLALTRNEIDLLNAEAKHQLVSLLRPTDSLLIAAAVAPCKTVAMLMDNFRMMQTICNALEQQPVSHIIYISSDAVYADSERPLTESANTAPNSLHGMMHITREMMLRSVVTTTPVCLLRPSLLYGVTDPHNGYGPNRFRRLAAQGKPMVLFGQGEEQRDHVFIDDVAELIYLSLRHKSQGVLNIATGQVVSFYQIAQTINAFFDKPVEIIFSPRKGPMPHHGYRPFAIDVCRQAFPSFQYTTWMDGLALTHSQMLQKAGA